MSAAHVAEEMTKSGVTHVHLALNPFVDPLAVVPGTAGETENVGGTGGVDSIAKQRDDIEAYLASGRWVISSTLHNSRYDDYSTLESIRRTGGVVPDEHWEENKRIIADVVKPSQPSGMSMTHRRSRRPTCSAARPTPFDSCIVSIMSSASARNRSSTIATGIAFSRKTFSPYL